MAAPWNTALVTGASSGIGAEIARQLASQGVDVVAVARDTARLKGLKAELHERHGTAVEVLTADLSRTAGVRKVEARLLDPEKPGVDLLVNNAGFGTHGVFWDLDVETEEREIQVNVSALVRLTHAALGPMVRRGRGAVLNVSSMAGEQSVPQNATYGATKAFVTSFSESLAEEVRGTGVTVTVLLPGFTRTEFQERAGVSMASNLPGFVWMEASDVAAEALSAAAEGKVVVVPGLGNKVVTATGYVVPRGIKRRVLGIMSRRL
jgi:hypothetical protein